MLLTSAQEALRKSGYLFLKGVILKDNMIYGFYATDAEPHVGVYIEERIYLAKTCSKEVATVLVVNNVEVIKY